MLVVLAAFALTLPCAAMASFPGTNGKIVFVSDDPDGRDLWTMNEDGSDRTNLSNSPGNGETSPSVSADGQKIVYRGNTQSGGFGEIFTMNVDGTGVAQLTSNGFDDFDPTWSPDGSKIAFTTQRDGDLDIYVMNDDGSDQIPLTIDGSPVDDLDPDWAPDGRIAWRSDRADNHFNFDVWVMNADGTGKTRLTNFTRPGFFYGPSVYDPSWSPDSERIAFSTDKDHWSYLGDPGCEGASACISGGPDIFTMASDGSDVLKVTTALGSEFQPAWSPDGTEIVYGTPFDEGIGALHVVSVDGTGNRTISMDPAVRDGFASWQAVPNRPPDCSGVSATPSTLQAANRRFRTVTLAGATDPDGDPVTLTITVVTQDERVRGPGDPTTPDAAAGGAADQVRLRAERSSRGDGRVYRVEFEASDGDLSCSGRAAVAVPRRRGVPAVDSAPPSYDSFGA
jgi:TolB protein